MKTNEEESCMVSILAGSSEYDAVVWNEAGNLDVLKQFHIQFFLTLSSMGGFWTDISKCSEGEGDQII